MKIICLFLPIFTNKMIVFQNSLFLGSNGRCYFANVER